MTKMRHPQKKPIYFIMDGFAVGSAAMNLQSGNIHIQNIWVSAGPGATAEPPPVTTSGFVMIRRGYDNGCTRVPAYVIQDANNVTLTSESYGDTLINLIYGATYKIRFLDWAVIVGNEHADAWGHAPGLEINNLNVTTDSETNGIVSGGMTTPISVSFTLDPGTFPSVGSAIVFTATEQMAYTDSNGVGLYYAWAA